MSDGRLEDVKAFWEEQSCGEALLLKGFDRAAYESQASERYRLEPYIQGFAGFSSTRDQRVLEIGTGLGADHQQFAEAGARLSGIDLTTRSIDHVRRRLALFDRKSDLAVASAEHLPFHQESFDLVYSWGVLHHTPDTPRAFTEALRVLRPGGQLCAMVYHKWSLVGLMLWIRYALLRLRPWTSLRDIYAKHLESPGTKAYSFGECRALLRGFAEIKLDTVLTHGDLLSSGAGQRHRGALLSIARLIWPRWLFRLLLPQWGLFLLVRATKPH